MEKQKSQPQPPLQVRPAETPLERATDIMWKRMLLILVGLLIIIAAIGAVGFLTT